MARKLDIGALMGAASDLDTGSMRVQKIPLDLIDVNPANTYTQFDIDDLAESIAVVGLQQPLVVQPNEKRYLLLAGHRRRAALEKLGRLTAPCVVLAGDLDPALQTLILHWTNTMARGGAGLTGEGMYAAAKEIEQALTDLKTRGVVELPGKLREYVADVLQVSESQLARAKAIENNLSKAFKGDYKRGYISDSVAYELSQCEAELQRKLHDAYKDKLYQLDAKGVKAHKKADASTFAPLICPANHISMRACAGTDKRAAAVKRGVCPGCCHDCNKSTECPWVCGECSKQHRAEKSAEEQRAVRDQHNAAFAASVEGKVYAHARAVLEQFGYAKGKLPGDMPSWALDSLWSNNQAHCSMPCMSDLAKAADLIGISLQELLFDNPEGGPLRRLEEEMRQAPAEPVAIWHPYPAEKPQNGARVMVWKPDGEVQLVGYIGDSWRHAKDADCSLNLTVKYWSTNLPPDC